MTTSRGHLSGGRALFCALVLGIAVPAMALAQESSPVTISNAVYQEVEVKAADGKVTTKLVPAERVAPGEDVIYEISYHNSGTETATELAIDNPLPSAVLFVAATTEPSAVSVDGGKVFGSLATLTVTGPEGQVRPARASDVTNLRWIVPSLAADATGKVTYRARVR